MKLNLYFFCIVFLLFSAICFGQNTNGYVVNNKGEITQCFLHNNGVSESTGEYVYRLPSEKTFNPVDIAKIQEFAVVNQVKCVRELIQIDVTPNRIKNAKEAEQMPEFDEGHAYLKVLYEGDLASLYSYYNEGITFFYYRVGQSSIELLYYKEYLVEVASGVVESRIKNNRYKEQLREALQIQDESKLKKLSYTKNSLVKLFENYHKEQAAIGRNNTKNDTKPVFKVRGGITANHFSAKMQDVGDAAFVAFKESNSIGYGLELEYSFAFNRNNLAVFAGGNYASYYSDYSDHSIRSTHDGYIWDYYSIDLPVGLRYYDQLFPKGRLLFELGYCPHIILDKSELFLKSDRPNEFSSASNVMFGAGVSFGRLYVIGRLFSKNNITQNLYKRGSEQKQWSISVQYDIFTITGK